MNISELILELEKMRSEHGDVRVYCTDCSTGFIGEVQFIGYESPQLGYIDMEEKVVIGY